MKKNDLNLETYKNEASLRYYSSGTEIRPLERKIIKKYFYGRVLDLGCGIGRTTNYLYKLGFPVTGIDITEEMIKLSKLKYPEVDFQVGDACNLDLEDQSFEIVFFSLNGIDSIYPENKRILVFKEAERLLKPKGYFIFSSHNPWLLLKHIRPKFLLRNLTQGSLFYRYKIERQSFGDLYIYYGSISKQIATVERATNLKFIESINSDKDYTYYVFQKLGVDPI